jgi:hypothetical protein
MTPHNCGPVLAVNNVSLGESFYLSLLANFEAGV